jgi:hypothetical protein
LTDVEELPGGGITGGVVGTTGSGSGVTVTGGGGVVGLFGSTVMTGAGDVGEPPPPHWMNATALPTTSRSLNAGRRRCDISVIYRSYQKGA